jgi:tetratricopeptide (TPR) repeat protein
MRCGRSVIFRAAARLAAALFVAGLTLGLAGCGDPLIQGGTMHFDAARFDKAAEVFEQAVAKNPGDAGAHLWLARSYSELGRIPESVMEYERAVSLNGSLESESNAHRLRYWRQQYVRGEALLREALVIDAKSPQRDDRMKQAADAFGYALMLAPQKGLTYYQMYRLHEARGEKEESLKNFNLALSRAGEDRDLAQEIVPVLKKHGRDAVLGGDYEQAVSDYSSAARLKPADLDLMIDLASAHLLLAESRETSPEQKEAGYREAGRVLEEVRRQRPLDPDAIYNLATIRIRSLDHAGAVNLLNEYMALRPRDPDAWQLLGEVKKELGRPGETRVAALASRAMALNRPVADARDWSRRAAERFGPGSDLGGTYARQGPPEEVHTLTESAGSLVELWFYFEGKIVAAFRDGKAVGDVLTLRATAP